MLHAVWSADRPLVPNSEGAMTATRGLEEARNRFAQTRPYVKSDPNLFGSPY